ncbi:helix-turn-helix domain-containing protein [Klebsiella variicola]|uniref:helix-turn-helix domain-containing protein n=1 Tax=Klebsiella variicola TaxID=244366 RepID=UPI0005B6182C|nr:helix-turn-helix domain-containing protein [Klebsiella variicola]MCE0250015.1 helix-turn-helix domain-containing protein [Klebsiella variicola subsp. variicola]GKJ06692.1 hypothetical protein NUKP23_19950 [Klebsiella variicola]CEP32466.1 hypothetical protein KV8917_720014 [Klebsiella variicola]
MSKQNRDSKNFVKLEYSVLDLTEYNGLTINGNMKILLSLVYSYDKTGRTYNESVGTIGKRCGCKPEAVRNFRNKLREAGMITFEEEQGKRHKISPVELDPSLMVFLDDHNSTQVSNRKKVETEESGKNEQKPVVESFMVESAAPVAGKPDGVPVVGAPVDDALPIDDNAPLNGPDGENVVEFPRSGRPKLSFKFVSPDDDDQEETYQGYGGDIEQETYSEPTQAEFDDALENLKEEYCVSKQLAIARLPTA